MSASVYASMGTRPEQLFHEDLVVESLSFYGQTFYYIPRTLVAKDEILGEDRLSRFKSAYAIQMYLENTDGFEGQGAFIQKFGLMMEQSATLVVARRKWEQLVGKFGQTIIPSRPCEGDLLYFPLTDAMFELKFVQYQDPFYQIGKLFVYKLQVELFQYASEHITTGIPDIDAFESLKTYDTSIVLNGVVTSVTLTSPGAGYLTAPTVVFGTDWAATTALSDGDEICYLTKRYIATADGTTGSTGPIHTSGTLSNGTAPLRYLGTRATGTATLGTGDLSAVIMYINITSGGNGYGIPPIVNIVSGTGSGAVAIALIENIDNQYSYGDNNKFGMEAESVIFNESNPFGDIE